METALKKQGKKRTRLFFLTLFLIGIIISFIIIMFPKPSTETIPYYHGEYPLLYKGNQEGNVLLLNDIEYIPISFFHQFIPELIHYDVQSQSWIMTTKADVIQLFANDFTYTENREKKEIKYAPLVEHEQDAFIALRWLKEYFPIHFEQLKMRNGYEVYTENKVKKIGFVKNKSSQEYKLKLRKDASFQSPYVAKVNKAEKVFIESEKDKFYFVRKTSGEAGFVRKELIELKGEEIVNVPDVRKLPKLKEVPVPINLTWEAVYTVTPDPKNIPFMHGVNVTSPTWFHLLDKDGNLKDLSSTKYVQWAKSNGLQIWALFSNDFNPDLTRQALTNYQSRKNIIDQLVTFAKKYNLDGINFDIENVYEEDGPYVTQLMKEATPILHQHGLIVSMDITFISSSGNWSKFYEREKLKEIVDYLIVMAYDEHTAGGKKAGSVASIPWVEQNLQRLLTIIPADKLILGIPLYTRLWKEAWDENGQWSVTGKALTMDNANQWITEHNLTPTYDEMTQQNFVKYVDDAGAVYKMWLEDARSLQQRANIARKHHLAGIATWSRYFANKDAWASLQEYYVNAN